MSYRVLDSISEGKKLAESRYKILNSETQSSIRTAFIPFTKVGMEDYEDKDGVEIVALPRMAASSSPLPSEARRCELVNISDGDEDVNDPIIISSSQ